MVLWFWEFHSLPCDPFMSSPYVVYYIHKGECLLGDSVVQWLRRIAPTQIALQNNILPVNRLKENIWSSLAQSRGAFQVIDRWVQKMSHKQQLLLMERSTNTVFLYMIHIHRRHIHRRTSPTVHLISMSTVITTIPIGKTSNP